jgi:hypothetical protein
MRPNLPLDFEAMTHRAIAANGNAERHLPFYFS